MIVSIYVEAWDCTFCHKPWLQRGEGKPKRCPNRKCRKLATDGRGEFLEGEMEYPKDRLPDPVVVENGGVLIDAPNRSKEEVERLNDEVFEDEVNQDRG